MAFDDLATKYRSMFAPSFKIMVEGSNIAAANMVIAGVSVDTSLDKADSFSFSVSNAFDPVKKEFKWLDRYLKVGKDIQIDIGYADVLETAFRGYITSVRYELTSWEQTGLVVSGMDYSFKLMKGIKSKVFSKMKDSDAARQVIAGAGLSAKVESTTVMHDMIQQVGISDYQFLCLLAERNGYEFFVSGNEVYFRKPHQNKSPAVTLTWGQNLLSLDKEDDLTDQLGVVKVRSWDPKTKKPIVGQAGALSKVDSGQDGKTLLNKALGKTVEDNYFSEARTQQQAEVEANAIQNSKAMSLVTGEASCIGIPEIRAGKYVKLAGLGSQLNKTYYITSARHRIDESGYITTLTIGGNAI
mgnify:CR=1 FL=1|jgi:hypothetical protein